VQALTQAGAKVAGLPWEVALFIKEQLAKSAMKRKSDIKRICQRRI
jgi:hypothetical protein